MQQVHQPTHEQAELHDYSSFPARDYNRWTNLVNELGRMGMTPKVDRCQQVKEAADLFKANPSATIDQQEIFVQKLIDVVGSYCDLAEAEAYLLFKGLETIPFDEIVTSTNETYVHYMGFVLEAGEMAARRLQAAIEDYESQRLSGSGRDENLSETVTLADEQSATSAGAAVPKEGL